MPGWGGVMCQIGRGGKGAVGWAAGGGDGVKSLLYARALVAWRIRGKSFACVVRAVLTEHWKYGCSKLRRAISVGRTLGFTGLA